MKSLMLVLSLMLSPLSLTTGEDVFVLTDQINLYSEASYSSEVLESLEYGEALTLLDEQNFNGFYYVTVKETSVQGYVPADLVGEKTQDQEVILSYNASILEDTQVLSLTSDEPICEISKGERVLLYEGYNKNSDYLAVKFIHNGNVIIGRVDTSYIHPDGVNAALIVSITAIVALVTIIIILLGISNKKRHKKLKKDS